MEKKQRTHMQKYWSSLAVVILVCAIILAGNYAEHHFGGYTAHYTNATDYACNYTQSYPLNSSGTNYTVMGFKCTNDTNYLLMIHNATTVRMVTYKASP